MMKACAVFCPVSRFDFSGQLREEGHIAVKFLLQSTYDCLCRHHLAVDHLKANDAAYRASQSEDPDLPWTRSSYTSYIASSCRLTNPRREPTNDS
jgi:hypothetical protein